MDDSALVAAIARKDPRGLDGAYRRYADPLHAYAWSLTKDRDAAADIVHDTFLLASQHVTQLRDPARLRQWLYAIARHEGLRQIRRTSRHMTLDPEFDVPADTVDMTAKAHSAEIAELVRAAFLGMPENDREVAELTVRHGMSASDIAAMLDISVNHAHARLSRAREQLTNSLAALLVARHGRDRCPELGELLSDWDGQLNPLLRKRINRHVESCGTCGDTKQRRFNPTALLAGYTALPFAFIPALHRADTDWGLVGFDSPITTEATVRLDSATPPPMAQTEPLQGPPPGRPVPPSPRWEREHGFPRQERSGKRPLPVLLTGSAAVLALLVGGGAIMLQQQNQPLTAAPSPSISDTPTASAAPSPSDAAAPTTSPSAGPVTPPSASPSPNKAVRTSAPPPKPKTSAPPPALTITDLSINCVTDGTGQKVLVASVSTNVTLSAGTLIHGTTTAPNGTNNTSMTASGKTAQKSKPIGFSSVPVTIKWSVKVTDTYGRNLSTPPSTVTCS